MDEQAENGDRRRLMIRGVLPAQMPRETCGLVERGMPILSREGRQVGKVAAVSVDEQGAVDAILLSRLPLKMAYRIVPARVVTAVRNHEVVLAVNDDAIEGLEKHLP